MLSDHVINPKISVNEHASRSVGLIGLKQIPLDSYSTDQLDS